TGRGANLDENDGSAVQRDQVDLAEWRADVACHDAEAGPAQETSRGAFGTTAEPAPPPRFARRGGRHGPVLPLPWRHVSNVPRGIGTLETCRHEGSTLRLGLLLLAAAAGVVGAARHEQLATPA